MGRQAAALEAGTSLPAVAAEFGGGDGWRQRRRRRLGCQPAVAAEAESKVGLLRLWLGLLRKSFYPTLSPLVPCFFFTFEVYICEWHP